MTLGLICDIERIQMQKDDENSIWFEVLQRLTKIETNTEDPLP